MNKKIFYGAGIAMFLLMTTVLSGCSNKEDAKVDKQKQEAQPQEKVEVNEGDQSSIAARETDWNIKPEGKKVEVTHKECGFGLSIPEKWKIDQKDNLYLAKEKGYSIISNEFKAAPYLSFTIICGNSVVVDKTNAYKLPREESKEEIIAGRNLSGDSVTKIQYITFERNGKKYSIEVRVNYSNASLLGNLLKGEEYKTYYKEEQQAIDSILRTFNFLD
jgi:hypothetical protein